MVFDSVPASKFLPWTSLAFLGDGLPVRINKHFDSKIDLFCGVYDSNRKQTKTHIVLSHIATFTSRENVDTFHPVWIK